MMGKVVTAVYEDGVLRPLDPLNLREHQEVRIHLLADEVQSKTGEDAVRVLVSAGLMRMPERGTPPANPVSEEERRALAERLGRAPGKPLSEIIIEDRADDRLVAVAQAVGLLTDNPNHHP
jgi:predicted DNA-binding antitoxin AbrB/MazE fold protein